MIILLFAIFIIAEHQTPLNKLGQQIDGRVKVGDRLKQLLRALGDIVLNANCRLREKLVCETLLISALIYSHCK